jgi:hypothetical protein
MLLESLLSNISLTPSFLPCSSSLSLSASFRPLSTHDSIKYSVGSLETMSEPCANGGAAEYWAEGESSRAFDHSFPSSIYFWYISSFSHLFYFTSISLLHVLLPFFFFLRVRNRPIHGGSPGINPFLPSILLSSPSPTVITSARITRRQAAAGVLQALVSSGYEAETTAIAEEHAWSEKDSSAI